MSLRRLILSSLACAFWLLMPTSSATLGQEAPAPSNDRVKKESAPQECTDSTNQKESVGESKESNRDIAIKAIDLIIDHIKLKGDAETVAYMESFRNEFPVGEDTQYFVATGKGCCEFIRTAQRLGELIAARQMVPYALRIADIVRDESPRLLIAAHSEAASVDIDFDLYESALKHISTARRVANEINLDVRRSIVLKNNYAVVLCKLKRFDEAEKIHLEVIDQITTNRNECSDFDLFNARFSLAITYAKKGAFDQYVKALPDAGKKQPDEDGESFAERLLLMDAASVNYNLSAGKLEDAEKRAQRAMEGSQVSFGASSCRHVEAIELLAKVRLAQKRNDDAVALLRKSAELREGLLGKDHPSTARLHKEIDAIRKKQLDDVEPVWTPPELESADRYGQAKAVGGAMK